MAQQVRPFLLQPPWLQHLLLPFLFLLLSDVNGLWPLLRFPAFPISSRTWMGATLGSFPKVSPPNYYRATRHGECTGVAEEQKTLLYEDW